MKFNLKSSLKAILSLLLFSALSASAQEGEWQSKMVDPNTNIYEVKESFESFWANKQITKGKGYKQYKRWEWFMEQRCFPTGVRFAPDAIYVAMQEQPEMFMFNENMPGSWSYIGNTSVPTGGGGAGRVNSVRHLPGSTTTFFACAPGGGLWKTTNSGVSWTMMNTDNLASIGVSDVAIDPNDTDVMYIATGDGDAGDTYSLGVLKTTDGGLTWNTTGLNWAVTNQRTTNRILIDPSNSQNVIAATSNGIYRTTNGGTSWTQVQGGSFKDLKFHPTNASIVYASSDAFYKSTDGGATWTNITSGLPSASNVSRMALAVSEDEPTWVYVLAGANNNGFYGIYKSTNSGTSFTQPYTGSLNLMGWDPSGTDSGGQAWYDLALEADPNDANVIYTGGVNIWKSSNGGTSWALNGHWYGGGGVPYVHADIHALHFVPGTSRLLVGCDGGVFTTLNGGTAYSDISSNLQIAQQYRLSVSAANVDIVLSGWQDNGTNLKNGSTFTRPIGGDGMDCQINPTNGNIMYGELYYGDIYKSTTAGVNFGTNICSSGGTGVDEDGAWVTPFVLGSENSDHVYVGKTRVYKSTNGGNTWTSLAAIGSGTINALHVATAENDYIYASKGGTLYVSSNNGTSFTTATGLPGGSITSIVTSTTNAQQVYVTISGFSAGQKVYMSTNAGSTWTNISGSLPNIPANAIAYQNGADNSLYVGTDAGVYYRDDVLGNWVPYMNGMPNVVVTDLDINYSANKIVASTFGRGLWSAPLYALPQLDAAITGFTSPSSTLCDTEVNAAFDILNAGEDNLTSITIEYQINGGAVQTYNWTGTLISGGTASINIPTFDLGTGAFTIIASIVDVNGQGLDENSLNDNGSVSYYVTGGTNNLTLTLFTDCYAEETSWEILQGSTVIFSGGGYVNDTEYTIPICIGDGCFTFNMNDSYGDGLSSCSGGDFTLVNDANSAILAELTTLNFGAQSSHNFCINVPTPGCTDANACNYNVSATTDDGSCTYGPINDMCAGAISLTVNGGNTLVNNTNTCNNAANPGCGGNTQILDMWYSFVYTGGDITITTSVGSASGFSSLTDTRIALYDACNGTMMLCDDDISTSNYYSQIVLPCSEFVQGQTYYVQAGGYNGASGVFNINVTATIVNGCTDVDATNYDSCANTDDGSCVYTNGCTDPSACNYDDLALVDDGSCFYASTYYRDQDNDGYGNLAVTIQGCSAPVGYVSNSTDCNDNNNAVYPNATEVCNTIDDDCDSAIDEGLLSTFYLDQDNDGYGNLAVTIQGCSAPVGYVSNSTDCNDNNNAVYPNATEVCNTIDDDCDSAIDEGVLSTFYRDQDNDGYGNLAVTIQGCSAPFGYVSNSTDCNDNNNAVYPNATEVCNTIDDDCDSAIDEGLLSTFYLDQDNDGYGNLAVTVQGCSAPVGYVNNSTDCNDNNNAVYPNATEVCNTIDDDCDSAIDEGLLSTFYLDQDNDGYGNLAVTVQACSVPVGYVSNSTDCNDNNNAVYPNASEVCNTIDDDCDSAIDEGLLSTYYRDQDNDGYGNLAMTIQACSVPLGYVSNSTDCNDNNNAVNPDATETCANSIDDDCDGQINEGCTPPPSSVVNDFAASATLISPALYPNCININGNLTNATPSSECTIPYSSGAGQDVWYRFVAGSTGMRFHVSSTSNDISLQLFDASLNPIDQENVMAIGQNEILNIGSLTQGLQYYLCVRNLATSSVGTFTLCMQNLEISHPDYGPNFSGACSKWKSNWTGCSLYTVTIFDGAFTGSYSSSSTIFNLYAIPGIQYNHAYNVNITSTYNLVNGAGTLEPISTVGGPFAIFINQHQDMDLRSTDRCPVSRAIGAFIASDISLCGHLEYEWEFLQVDPTDQITMGLPVYAETNSTSRFIRTSAISGVAPGNVYRVRIRPLFSYGAGDFGTDYQLLCIAAPAGISEGSELNNYLRQTNSESIQSALYPNPNEGEFVLINVDGLENESIELSIVDMLGRTLDPTSYVVKRDGSTIRVDFKNQLTSGQYLIKMNIEGDEIIEKMMVH